jgi:hypothetical protein
MTAISKAIQTLPNLKEVKLNLAFNEARGQGMVDVVKMFFRKGLERVWLGLSNNPLEDGEVRQLLPYLKAIGTRTPFFEF